MKSRGMEIHLALLGVALAGAWFSWFSEADEPSPEGEVTLWDLGAAPIEKISYTSEKLKAVITAQPGDDGAASYFWAKSERAATPAKGAAPKTAAAEPIKKSFRISRDGAKKAREGFGKLIALRNLGALDTDKRADFGLAPPLAEVVVTAGGQPHTLHVGIQAHGANLRYVCTADNTCFVMKGGLLDDLKWADSRLYERNLFRQVKKDIVGLKVLCNDQSIAWTREVDESAADGADAWNRSPSNEAASPAEGATEPNPQKWLNQLFRIRVVRYLSETEDVKPSLRTEMKIRDGSTLWIELAKQGAADATTFLARSPQSGGWVEMSNFLGKEMDSDLSGLCGL